MTDKKKKSNFGKNGIVPPSKTRVASFQLVKPFARKLASDNLVSTIFFPFTALQQRKQNHQLHHNESMRTMKPRCLKKPVFRLSLAKGTRRKGIMLGLERFIRQILALFLAKDILQSTIFRTMCS